jgi:hypothetical protein
MVQQSESTKIRYYIIEESYNICSYEEEKKTRKNLIPLYSALPATGVVLKQLPDIHRMPRRSCSLNGVKLMGE